MNERVTRCTSWFDLEVVRELCCFSSVVFRRVASLSLTSLRLVEYDAETGIGQQLHSEIRQVGQSYLLFIHIARTSVQ